MEKIKAYNWKKILRANWLKLSANFENFVSSLLDRLEESKEPQADVFLEDGEVFFVVVAKDWAGLLDAVSSVIHDRGYNIKRIFAGVLHPSDYALIVLSISSLKPDSEILKDKQGIIEILRIAAKGGIGLKSLISISGVKIRKYKEVVDGIVRVVPKEELQFLLGDQGEAIMFIRSRTEAYLEERDARTLAEIIVWQNRLYRYVKENPSLVKVFFHNFTTTKGMRMSGITVVGLDKYVSLDSVLSVLSEEGIEKIYEKEFIYPEGISVVRIETKEIPLGKLARIAESLEETLKKPKTRRYIDIKFGLEIIGRVIVPRLIEEYINTGIPQLLIFPEEADPERPIFRVILVGDFDNFAEELGRRFSESGCSFQLPKFSEKKEGDGRVSILIFQTSTSLRRFDNQEQVYQEIKKIISEFVPKFRDFDEGLRKITVSKLNNLYEMLEGIPRKIVRRIYYSLEDTFRIAKSEKEIAEIISFLYSSVERYLEQQDRGLKTFQDEKRGICLLVGESENEVASSILLGEYNGYKVIGTVEIFGVFAAICIRG
jgi:uncharacterized protein with ACT and thioredoxin-like domain